jgi:ABC-2 type transport system permease protein
MSKVGIIVEREFMTRVKNKQFIIFTLLGPLLISLVVVIPLLIALYSDDNQQIWVDDRSGQFAGQFESRKGLEFVELDPGTGDLLKDSVKMADNTGLLIIPEHFDLYSPKGFAYYSSNPLGSSAKESMTSAIRNRIEAIKLQESGLSKGFIDSLKSKVKIETFKLTEQGIENSSTDASTGLGFAGAFIMYLFIFIYGTMVLRGVVEEKSNRIMEVMVSSVRPFEMMLGKILGIAAVGLLQFVLWIVLSFGIITVAQSFLAPETQQELVDANVKSRSMGMELPLDEQEAELLAEAKAGPGSFFDELKTVNLPYFIAMFLFYFLTGYLLYAALFAAVGSAVDNETDTQQLLFPITIPIIIAIIVAQMVIQNPTSAIAFWFSIIPLTAPIVMIVRIPFGVPGWELALSMLLMVGGFLFTTWVAARIYRVGVLMYGKKVSLKEVSKWLFYR